MDYVNEQSTNYSNELEVLRKKAKDLIVPNFPKVNGPCILYILHYPTSSYLYVSENVKLLSGYSANDLINGGIPFVMSLIHPKDRVIIQNESFLEMNKLLRSTPSQERSNIKFSYNWRFRRSDQQYVHWLQQFNIIESDIEGNPIVQIGIGMDISHLKMDNKIVFSADWTDLNGNFMNIKKEFWPEPENQFNITSKEREVLKLIVNGFSSKMIASKLGISEYTVKDHRKHLFVKSQVKNTAQLVDFVHQQRIF